VQCRYFDQLIEVNADIECSIKGTFSCTGGKNFRTFIAVINASVTDNEMILGVLTYLIFAVSDVLYSHP
jgi:hypothetical protein